MAIVAAVERNLPPAAVAFHGTHLCARNGADMTSSSNEQWARCIVNNLLRQHVGVSLMFFRQAYEVPCLPICARQLTIIREMQGVGRKIGLKLDKAIAENCRAREMLALLEAHSHATSLEEYALDEDVFRGLSPEDRASWAAIGEHSNFSFSFSRTATLRRSCVQQGSLRRCRAGIPSTRRRSCTSGATAHLAQRPAAGQGNSAADN